MGANLADHREARGGVAVADRDGRLLAVKAAGSAELGSLVAGAALARELWGELEAGATFVSNDPQQASATLEHVVAMCLAGSRVRLCVAQWPDVGRRVSGVAGDRWQQGLVLTPVDSASRDVLALLDANLGDPAAGRRALAAQLARLDDPLEPGVGSGALRRWLLAREGRGWSASVMVAGDPALWLPLQLMVHGGRLVVDARGCPAAPVDERGSSRIATVGACLWATRVLTRGALDPEASQVVDLKVEQGSALDAPAWAPVGLAAAHALGAELESLLAVGPS
jgi:hypothetical protein